MADQEMNMALANATLLMQPAPGVYVPFEYDGLPVESTAYRTSAMINVSLMTSPIYDIVGPDACAFLQSICVNDFTKLKYTGLRHAVICNDKGQILSDGVVIRIAEDRYRTYWLNPPIQYLCENSDLDVHGEDMSGTEFFIQVQGEKSLEILEEAFQADLHDIKFAKHRIQDVEGTPVQVIHLGMTGNLAYEVHGPIADYTKIYNKIWAAGQKFGAKQQGQHCYCLFNHTEAGFPNINLHYPLPWFESGEGLAKWCMEHPGLSCNNMGRRLNGSVGDDLQTRFVTPYDTGLGFLVKFNHDFMGREALEKIAKNQTRNVCTLEWDPESVGKVFAAMNTAGNNVEDISDPTDCHFVYNFANQCFEYRADKVLDETGRMVGISSGRIHSYSYGTMISLGFIDPACIQEGRELTLVWGTPGTDQMDVKVRVARYPYNKDLVRNEDRDVSEIPTLGHGRMVEQGSGDGSDWSEWYKANNQ
ncbi:MAG: hypothetical protein ACOYJL_00530 [Tractidigestivibacter sp.]|jgi:vanillate/3-O-methylgallate O-demethylase|uniref:hypothetical protein n=1 Tax=Tractidigestivibacter sp. TaxID=2847320 RepID=UPI003D8A97A8